MNLGHQLTPYTRTNSQWLRNLNVSLETIKILEETIDSKISAISCSNMFADTSPRTENKGENKQMELHQNKKLCTAKGRSTK